MLLWGFFQRMEEHITKNSPTLGRDAVYKKSVSIWLTFSFMNIHARLHPLRIIII